MNGSGNDILGRTGRPWAKWANIGDTVSGTVIEEPDTRQARDYESGEKMVWPNGEPKLEVIVPIQTGQTDPDILNDNGERLVVLPVGSPRFRAVQSALKQAGSRGLYPGDKIAIRYVEDGPRSGKKNPPKIYGATYTKNSSAKVTDMLAGLGVNVVGEEAPPF